MYFTVADICIKPPIKFTAFLFYCASTAAFSVFTLFSPPELSSVSPFPLSPIHIRCKYTTKKGEKQMSLSLSLFSCEVYFTSASTSCANAALMMSVIVGAALLSVLTAMSPPRRKEITLPSHPENIYVPPSSIVEGKSLV